MEGDDGLPGGPGLESGGATAVVAAPDGASYSQQRVSGPALFDLWCRARDRALVMTDADEAEDIASEVVQTIVRHIETNPGFVSEPDNNRYVFTLVANRVADRRRRTRRRGNRERLLSIDLEVRRSPWGQPDKEMNERSERMEIERAVEALPNRARLIWYLRHDEQKTPREIATELGLSISSVYAQLERSLKLVRKAVRATPPELQRSRKS